MTPLESHFKNQIREAGPISLSHYIELCLSHPEHGYYMSGDPFGKEGDFITSPEISQIFGELIGVWLADLWHQAGSPKKVTLLECGPGRGTLMVDVLRATKNVGGLHDSLQIKLLENSLLLQQKQKDALNDYDVKWLTSLDELQTSTEPVFVIANEFFDALPIKQFEKVNEGWAERCIGLNDNNELTLSLIPSARVNGMPAGLSNGQIVETSFARDALFSNLCELIQKNGGALLAIDYGYLSGNGDTLQAVKKHQKVSIFETPGESDLTAHIDFQRMIEVASDKGIDICAVKNQGEFLRNLGIELRASVLKKNAGEKQAQIIDSSVRRLCDTDEMGALFKAFCVHAPIKKIKLLPAGF